MEFRRPTIHNNMTIEELRQALVDFDLEFTKALNVIGELNDAVQQLEIAQMEASALPALLKVHDGYTGQQRTLLNVIEDLRYEKSQALRMHKNKEDIVNNQAQAIEEKDAYIQQITKEKEE